MKAKKKVALILLVIPLFSNIVKADTITQFIEENNFNILVSDEAQVRSELDSLREEKKQLTDEQKRINEISERLAEYESKVNAYIANAEEDRLQVDRYNEQLESRKLELLNKKEKALEGVLDKLKVSNDILRDVQNTIESSTIADLKNKCKKVLLLQADANNDRELINTYYSNETAKEYSYNIDEIEMKYKEKKEILDSMIFIRDEKAKEVEAKESNIVTSSIPIQEDNFDIGTRDLALKSLDGWVGDPTMLQSTKEKDVKVMYNGMVSKTGYSKLLGNYVVILSGATMKVTYYNIDNPIKLETIAILRQGDVIGKSKKYSMSLYIQGAERGLNKVLEGDRYEQ